jgi:mono/diheme cytochrome c family protein
MQESFPQPIRVRTRCGLEGRAPQKLAQPSNIPGHRSATGPRSQPLRQREGARTFPVRRLQSHPLRAGTSRAPRFRLWRAVLAHVRQIGVRCIALVVLGGSSALLAQAENPSAKPEPGLVVTFAALEGDKAKASDLAVLPNVWIYVGAGKPPTPFLPGGKFSAVWTGFISSELRDNYSFKAELNGEAKLEINGAVALEVSGKGAPSEAGKPVRLNKGTNAFKLTFTSPAQGAAFIRLFWSSSEFALEPIALGALSHEPTLELRKADQVRLGRELFVEHRCGKCHAGPGGDTAMPELAMDAPSFDGIGSRRNYDWMARWILDPKLLRPTAQMPRLLHGTKAKEDAEAIAAVLSSLKSDSGAKNEDGFKEPGGDRVETGRKLFDALQCVACHAAPGSTAPDPGKIALRQVREKFAPGSLTAFLQKPEEHYAWIRMPNFKLSVEEAAQLAAFLVSVADKPKDTLVPADRTMMERGKKLVQTAGCLNCHSGRLENQFKALLLTELPADKWREGCVAEMHAEGSKAPQFSFAAAEREGLQAFAATDRVSLSRHVPVEFEERQSRLLNCRECHGKIEGVPVFETLGEKLRPEWSKAFIAGDVSYKPRPWLASRMPAFAERAGPLAEGMAALRGYPPQTPSEPPIDQEAAKIGRKLVSASGGFFCVSCHGVGSVSATQVFEAPGINLAYSGERLLKPHFHRWLRNPLRIDPTTKMPVYFDNEGKSPLAEVYGGDATKQIEAIWQYTRLGSKMPSPLAAE